MWLPCAMKDMDSPILACPCTHCRSWTWLQSVHQPAPCLLVETESCVHDKQHQSSSDVAYLHSCLYTFHYLPRRLCNCSCEALTLSPAPAGVHDNLFTLQSLHPGRNGKSFLGAQTPAKQAGATTDYVQMHWEVRKSGRVC